METTNNTEQKKKRCSKRPGWLTIKKTGHLKKMGLVEGLPIAKAKPTVSSDAVPPGLKLYREWARPQANYVQGMEGDPPKHKLPRKKPWYLLGRTEIVTICGKHPPTKMSRKDYIKGYIKQKIDKWEKNNPCPEAKYPLFKQEFMSDWTILQKAKLEAVTEAVNSLYGHVTVDVMTNCKKHENYESLRLGKDADSTLRWNMRVPSAAANKLQNIVNKAAHELGSKIDGIHVNSYDKSRTHVIPVLRDKLYRGAA